MISSRIRFIAFAATAALITSIFSINASAQTVSIGGKVGAPLNDSFESSQGFNNNYTFFTKRYTVGPTFELMFPAHIGFEADALYKRSGYTQNFTFFDAETKLNSWEFPLLFKAALPAGESFGVFGDGGLTFRHVQGSTTYSDPFTSPLSRPLELTDPWAHGFVAGGGVSLRVGSIRFEPELRYTRWASGNFSVPAFISNPNQIDYLLGVKFTK